MSRLTLEMLPAAEGDALLLSYGPENSTRRILIDGGRRSTYGQLRQRLLKIPLDDSGVRRFELLIVTHVDADHIEGVICLLQDHELACEFDDIWFNDWNHLEPLREGFVPEHLGVKQGEFLGALIERYGQPWNRKFRGGAVVVPPEEEPLPIRSFRGGLQLTLVSPTIGALIELREEWEEAIEAAGFDPGDRDAALAQFSDMAWARLPPGVTDLGDEEVRRSLDHKEANGSSIAVLAEYGGSRLLLSGDAWPQVLRPTLARWRAEHAPAPERVELDAFKIPHHGSSKNMTPQLMDEIACRTYLVSTSGARFRHPDVEALELILEHHHGDDKPILGFNYRSEYNGFWARNDACVARYEDEAILRVPVPG